MALKLVETEGEWTTAQVTVKIVQISPTPHRLDDDTRKRLTDRILHFSTGLRGQQENALRLFWGIEDGFPKNSAEIAQKLRLTKNQVEQILADAENTISTNETAWLEEHAGSLA